MQPTVAGFLSFIRLQMGISATVLPDDSVYIGWAYAVAVEIVNLEISCISKLMYALAVYNLAGDNLVNYAQDNPDLTPPDNTFFADLRTAWDITGFVAGVIQSSADVTTSESLLVPDFMQGLTMADLQNLKTPYGRAYLAIAQRTGTIWGVS